MRLDLQKLKEKIKNNDEFRYDFTGIFSVIAYKIFYYFGIHDCEIVNSDTIEKINEIARKCNYDVNKFKNDSFIKDFLDEYDDDMSVLFENIEDENSTIDDIEIKNNKLIVSVSDIGGDWQVPINATFSIDENGNIKIIDYEINEQMDEYNTALHLIDYNELNKPFNIFEYKHICNLKPFIINEHN